MKTLTTDTLESIDLINKEILLLASKLHEQGKLSLDKVAELAGLNKNF